MLTYLRYALATFCFAASVGCLALWVHTVANERRYGVSYSSTLIGEIRLRAIAGTANAERSRNGRGTSTLGEWRFVSAQFRGRAWQFFIEPGEKQSLFGHTRTGVFFPLWYPALIFALAGVGVLRLNRRFTIRSAIIATTVVAALLGMAVIM